MRPTSIYSLSTELGANTIDPDKLNCRVRNGNGCDLVGINISLIKASYYKRTNLRKELLHLNTSFQYCNPARRLLGGSSLPYSIR